MTEEFYLLHRVLLFPALAETQVRPGRTFRPDEIIFAAVSPESQRGTAKGTSGGSGGFLQTCGGYAGESNGKSKRSWQDERKDSDSGETDRGAILSFLMAVPGVRTSKLIFTRRRSDHRGAHNEPH